MKILFEDNPRQPVSEFLKSILRDNSMYFTAGGLALVSTARVLVSNGEEVYCYVDMCWDNPFTEDIYCDLLNLASLYGNMHVRRIPCIEYYIILYLQLVGVYDFKRGYHELSILSGGNIKTVRYSAKSFERYCKGILSSARKKCIRNDIDGVNGKYYKDSCPCEYEYCEVKAELEDKVKTFYVAFPGVAEIPEISSQMVGYPRIGDVEEEVLYSRMWHMLYD